MSSDKQDQVEVLVDAFNRWAEAGLREDVHVQRSSEGFCGLEVCDFQLGTRPGGKGGIHVLDLWGENNRDALGEQHKLAKGYQNMTVKGDHYKSSKHRLALELVSRLTPPQKEAQNANLASVFCAKADAEGDLSKAEAWLPVSGPNSSVALRLFQDGEKTVLNKVLSLLCGDTIDLVQYGLSLLNARVRGYLPDSKDGRTAYKVVIADLQKPLWRDDATGYRRFASTAGGDGNCIFTWLIPFKDEQGQVRAFTASLTKGEGIIVKGVTIGDAIGLDVANNWTDNYNEVTCPILLCDLNMIKGRGKLHPMYKAAKEDTSEEFARPFVVEDDAYAWFIRTTKDVGEHAGAQSESFQGAPFYYGAIEGDDDQRGCYNLVDSDTLTSKLKDKLCNISESKKALVDECLAQVDINLENFRMDNNGIPYRAMLESVSKDLERAASAGTFRKAQLLKVSGNQLCPAGVVIMTEYQLAYGLLDQNEADSLKEEFLSGDLDFFQSEYYLQGYASFGRRVAHKRTPQLSPFGISTSRAICQRDLQHLALAIYSGEERWTCMEDFELSVEDTLEALRTEHNAKVIDRGYQEYAPENPWVKAIDFTNDLGSRLFELYWSLSAAKLDSFFVAQPMDGRDRNEDHDGDDTCACPSRFFVDKYLRIERWAMRIATPFINELPKETKMNCREDRFKQPLSQPDGELKEEINVQGASLAELFEDITWCTKERLAQVIDVTTSDSQGPTGMASNVAADLFARVKWRVCPSGKRNRRGDLLIVPTQGTVRIFVLWVLYCLLVQIFIDWQKRRYRKFKLIHGPKVAQALLNAGWAGLKDFSGVLSNDEYATLETEYNGKPELAKNWCFAPEHIYAFAQDQLDIEVCYWKWKRGRMTFRVTSAEIMDAMKDYAPTRFRSVVEAYHSPKTGVKAQFGKSQDYVEWVSCAVKDAKDADGVKPLVDLTLAAFQYIESQTLQAGEHGDLEKVGASHRGGLFLQGLGFNRDAVEKLLSGEPAKSTMIKDKEWVWSDLLVAAAHGAAGREVDAFEILVSFYVAQKERTQAQKELTALGEDFAQQFLRGIATEPKFDRHIPLVEDEPGPYYRSMSRDLHSRWECIARSGRKNLEKVISEVAKAALEAETESESALSLGKAALNQFLKLVQVAELYASRTDRRRINGKLQSSHRFPIFIPKEEYQLELSDLKRSGGNNSSNVSEGDDGSLYVRHDRAPHLTNRCDLHAWMGALDHDDPVRMAYGALQGKRAFRANPDALRAYTVAMDLLRENPELLVKCRTLTNHGGYFTDELIDRAIPLTYREVDWDDDVAGGMITALNLLRGCSSRLVNFGDEWKGSHATKQFFRQELLNGACDMLQHPVANEEELNWANWLSDYFDLTPLPERIKWRVGEEDVKGEAAAIELVKALMMYKAVNHFITLTAVKSSDRWDEYNDARAWLQTQVEEYNIPCESEKFAKSVYAFTAMSVDKKNTLAKKIGRFNWLSNLARVYMELGV